MAKNLIVLSVFLKKEYVELAYLLLNSLNAYGDLDDSTDILIYTSTEFMVQMRPNIKGAPRNPIFKTNDSIQTVVAASAARLDIFDFPEVAKYEKILYLDTDVLVIRALKPIFDLATEDRLYALEEGSLDLVVPYDYWGKDLFAPGEVADLEDKTGFSAGVLLFKNTETMRALFQRIKAHIASTPGSGFFEQAHMVYNAIKSDLKENQAMKPYVAINETSVKTTKTILHFAGSPGDHQSKHTKMSGFLRLFESGGRVVTTFGSDRVTGVANNTRLSDTITYTHTTKEILQLIYFLRGYLCLQAPYNTICFRSAILRGAPIQWNPIFRDVYRETNVFVVEISSRKKYMHSGLCLHDLSVDKRFPDFNRGTPANVLEEFRVEEQTDQEIREDLLELKATFAPRKMVVVSHYNAKLEGEYLPSRNMLIQFLKGVCAENAIPFLDPTEMLSEFPQEAVISPDLSHYTQFGMNEFTKRLNAFI
jgi:hypothetical protein